MNKEPKCYGLLTGVGIYEDEERKALYAAKKDLSLMRQALADGLKFDPDNIRVLGEDGNVKAKNHHALGTGSYITKLYSKSVAKHRCDYKQQIKGDRTVKKEENMKIFGYKRPKK